MDRLSKIERQRQIVLPECYKLFYRSCSILIPSSLVGTDLVNNETDLQEEALSLLQEDGAENFLSHNDFVFMMHQGYMFWYFKADGNSDPIVYGYHEGRLKPDDLGPLSSFVKKYVD